MCDTLNDLSKYYFDKFNIIFKSDKHTDDSLSNHQAFILIEFIKQYYNLSSEAVQFLKTNKGTLRELVDCLDMLVYIHYIRCMLHLQLLSFRGQELY